jgi:hypothetical protein
MDGFGFGCSEKNQQKREREGLTLVEILAACLPRY